MNVKMQDVLMMNSNVEVVNVFQLLGNAIFTGQIVQMALMKQIAMLVVMVVENV
jgi:hypothetical protein